MSFVKKFSAYCILKSTGAGQQHLKILFHLQEQPFLKNVKEAGIKVSKPVSRRSVLPLAKSEVPAEDTVAHLGTNI